MKARRDAALGADGLHDISVAFDAATPAWPGDTPFTCGWSWAIADGASVNVSRWDTSPHVGTHADAPLHVLADGASADRLPIAPFLGAAVVVDVAPDAVALSVADLVRAGFPVGAPRLLLRTSCSTASGRFPERWPALTQEAAAALTRAGLLLLGVDAPSVDERESKALPVHRALFAGGAYVLENLDLRAIRPGAWDLVALPLRTGPCDAAPVRAFLRPPRDT
ncbi:MAG: cyclase family protein [Gemmatimonadaceae bacterium]